jgi:hypothetical protein
LLAWIAAPAWAQFYLNGNGNGNGNGFTVFGGSVTLQAIQTETSSAFGGDTERTDLREALNFYFRSFLWDPRFMTYRLSTDLAQRNVDSGGSETAVDAMGYGVDVAFFPKRRIPLALFYSKYDQETEFDAQQFLSDERHNTRYGGRFEARLSKAPRLRIDYEKHERESEGSSSYLYDDTHLTGNSVYTLGPSIFELDYNGYETFDELRLSLQENNTWMLRNDNKLGKKHQVNFYATRNEAASEQAGFARSEAEFSTYTGQWSGSWSKKWGTAVYARQSEGESALSTSEADSYGVGTHFSPNMHWTVNGETNTYESTVTTADRESVLDSRTARLNTLWTGTPRTWHHTLSAGAGQSDSTLEWVDLVAPGPTERAQFDRRVWSAGGSIMRAKNASSVSLSSLYNSSEFDVERTAGIVLGAGQTLGYAQDVVQMRLDARKAYRKLGHMRAYVSYTTSERLLEDGTFSDSRETSLKTFWNNHKWSFTAGYGVIESRAISGVEAENTFFHASAKRQFKKHWSFRAFYNQSETTIGILDPGEQRQYEASLDYSGKSLSLRLMARQRETERGAAWAEFSSYYVTGLRRRAWQGRCSPRARTRTGSCFPKGAPPATRTTGATESFLTRAERISASSATAA